MLRMIGTSSYVFSEIGESSIDAKMELSDIFYSSEKKGYIFRVKLNAKGFTLQQESTTGENIAMQTLDMNDIIGSRCMRMKKSRRLVGACGSCRSVSSSTEPNKMNIDDNDCTGDSSAYLYVFAYVLKKNLRKHLRRERTVLTLRFRSFDSFEENMWETERWCKILQHFKNIYSETIQSTEYELSNPYKGCERRLLIFLNPKSGSGKARELFHHQVVPVLNEANLSYDLYVTKHAKYAYDFVRRRELCSWTGIIAVGGDGLFHEILNGLSNRIDSKFIFERISLGVVPCGSGNGLARSVAHLYNEPYDSKPILGAALTIVSGHHSLMDVVRIEVENQILYSFLSFGWGLISDIDIESERLRSLGYQRFTLWTLHRLISLRTYRGRVSYLPKSDLKSSESKTTLMKSELPASSIKHSKSCNIFSNEVENGSCYQSFECINGNLEFEDIISLETSGKQSIRSRCGSWLSVGSHKSTYYSISESVYHSVADDSDVGSAALNNSSKNIDKNERINNSNTDVTIALNDPVPENWTVEEGEFVMVHGTYQTHIGADCFFAPMARLNDGIIYLVIIRAGIARSQLLNFLMNMSSGTHIPSRKNEFIKVVAITAFRIEPHSNNGIITVDGERIPFGALQGEIIPGLAKIMVPRRKKN